MFYNNPDTPAHTHTGRDTQMSSSMSPVAPAGEINMQSSTKLSGTHKHTWKEPREGRGEGIALRAEESPGEKIYILQAKKSEAGGRRPQTGEGVYRRRGFSGKKKGKVKEKNALDWEKINQKSAGEKISFKTWAEIIQTAVKQVRWAFLLQFYWRWGYRLPWWSV